MAASQAVLSRKELAQIRADFPVLSRTVRGGQPLVYLDSSATSQMPRSVIERMLTFSERSYGAVHRGAHALAEESTIAFEQARAALASFVGVEAHELAFALNSTEAINELAYAIGNASAGRGGPEAEKFALRPGDQIMVTEAEHHANLIPWQELAARTGAELTWVKVGEDGRLRTDELEQVVTEKTRIMAFTHASNVTGAVTDVPAFVAAAKAVGAFTVLDAAQSAPHKALNLHQLGVDFAVFSGHKMLGPTGIGALYGRAELLASLPPAMFGGSMVEIVTMDKATFQTTPTRFEAGTQPVQQAVGWHAAIDYLNSLGMDAVAGHEQELTERLVGGVQQIDGVRLLGPSGYRNRLGVVSVEVEGVHPHDVGQILDASGVAVRVGHHCAQPVHRAFGVHASTRASVGVYTTMEECDRFLDVLAQVGSYFGVNA